MPKSDGENQSNKPVRFIIHYHNNNVHITRTGCQNQTETSKTNHCSLHNTNIVYRIRRISSRRTTVKQVDMPNCKG